MKEKEYNYDYYTRHDNDGTAEVVFFCFVMAAAIAIGSAAYQFFCG